MDKQLDKSIHSKFMQLVDESKPYLQPDLRQEKKLVAEKLGIAARDLDHLVKDFHQKTFAQLMREYRINQAKEILADPRFEDMKITEIAFHIGFCDLWDFNLNFKEMVNLNPTEYRAFHMNFKKMMGKTPMEYKLEHNG